MPADRSFSIRPGASGLNLRDSSAELGLADLADSLNWRLDEVGALVKRLGFTTYNAAHATADPVTELGVYQKTGASIKIVAAESSGKVETSPGDGTWTQINGGHLLTGLPAIKQFGDTLYFQTTADGLRSWDGTTWTDLPTSATNDVQTLSQTGAPAGGTFLLTFNGYQTTPIAYNATAAAVQAALQLLPSIGFGGVTCTGGPLPGTPVVCTFASHNAGRPQAVMAIDTSLVTGGTITITHTTTGASACPKGQYLATWQGRLFTAGDPTNTRRVRWSAIGDGATWPVNNYVDLTTQGEPLTGLVAAPNIGQGATDGADGVLCFSHHSTHRIIDASDNEFGVATGGANVLVDGGTGCVSHRSIAQGYGRVYLLADDGIYSTDGHAPLRLESGKLGRWVADWLATPPNACGVIHNGSYLLALTSTGDSVNSLVFEVFLRVQGEPIMAHSMPVTAWCLYPTTSVDTLYFADSSSGDTKYLRKAFTGGSDCDGDGTTTRVVTAVARTGTSDFEWPGSKRIRLIELLGRGQIVVGVVADLEFGVGEAGVFALPATSDYWDRVNDRFGVGVWGDNQRVGRSFAAYTRAGRRIGFTITESSTTTSSMPSGLGRAGAPSGGAAVNEMAVRVTPLNRV